MALNLITFRNSVANLFNKNNTTTVGATADISNGLQERVKQVITGYSKQPVININYPTVFVELKSKSEEFALAANTAIRDHTILMDIVGVVDFGVGQQDGRNESDDEMILLSSNLERLVRQNPRLSNTSQIRQAAISNVDYDVVESSFESYNSITRISLEIEVHSD